MIHTNQAVALRPPSVQYCERYCKKRRIVGLLPPKNSKSGTTNKILGSVVNFIVYFFFKLQRVTYTNQAVALRPPSVQYCERYCKNNHPPLKNRHAVGLPRKKTVAPSLKPKIFYVVPKVMTSYLTNSSVCLYKIKRSRFEED